MNAFTEMKMKMMNKKMATKALEIMKSVLAQTEAFEHATREELDSFATTLNVKGSGIISSGLYNLKLDANRIVFPEMFKAVARCFFHDKFSAYIYYETSYDWEEFDISYEAGKLVINSFCHDSSAEPYCPECDDCYEYFEEDDEEGYRCCECGHTISVEEYKAACEKRFENTYAIL